MYGMQSCCCVVHSPETMLMLIVIAKIWEGKIYSGLDFGIGIIRPIFHRLGMLSVDSDRFMSLVTYAILIGPKCFSIIGAMLCCPRCPRNCFLSLLTVVGCDVNCLLN